MSEGQEPGSIILVQYLNARYPEFVPKADLEKALIERRVKDPQTILYSLPSLVEVGLLEANSDSTAWRFASAAIQQERQKRTEDETKVPIAAVALHRHYHHPHRLPPRVQRALSVPAVILEEDLSSSCGTQRSQRVFNPASRASVIARPTWKNYISKSNGKI